MAASPTPEGPAGGDLAGCPIGDLMKTEVISVRESVKVREAIALVVEHKIAGLPVVDEENHLIGVVSEKELLISAASGQMDGPLQFCRTPDAVTRDTIIKDVLVQMLKRNRKWLPVLSEEWEVLGVIARRDLLAWFGEEPGAE